MNTIIKLLVLEALIEKANTKEFINEYKPSLNKMVSMGWLIEDQGQYKIGDNLDHNQKLDLINGLFGKVYISNPNIKIKFEG